MKSITAKVITISSQFLVVMLFLGSIFLGTKNTNSIVINNNNLDKMADKTLSLFKREELLLNSIDDSIVVPLTTEDSDEMVVTDDTLDSEEENVTEVIVEDKEKVISSENISGTSNLFYDKEVIDTVVGNLTGYGANCYGCSGYTAAGHNLNVSMYYDDNEYGTVRILAADSSFPFYSIFRVSNVPGMEDFIGIVLDRGGNVGFDRGTLFDLAFVDEKDPNLIAKTSDVKFEMLRSGK